MRLELLESVGRYEVVGELGAGAMSKVYLAHDPNLDRRVALKVLLQTWSTDHQELGELEKRFLLEARAAGRLSHPNIVRVFDADTDPGSGIPYIAMEWIRGGSLAALMTQEAVLSGPDTLKLLAEVARALDYAHNFGRIHRDIKPSNILIATDGGAKVSDFGVAKIVAETHTISGQVLGTPAYMSPEQVRDEPLDGRSDLFSLGAVLYQCVSGRTPFTGDSLVQIVYKILNVDPRPLSLPRTEGWILLKEIIDRALQKDPAARYQNGAQFAEFLDVARQALGDEDDTSFRRESVGTAADPAGTVRFHTPTPNRSKDSPTVDRTNTLELSNSQIRRAVEREPRTSANLLDTGAPTETTAIYQKRVRWHRRLATLALLVALGAVGTLAYGQWQQRKDLAAVERLASAQLVTIAPVFSANSVQSSGLDLPKDPPGLDKAEDSTTTAEVDVRPPPEPSAKPRQSVPLLPPSALSRTGVSQVENGEATTSAQDILTPVTIMYRHKGGAATLQVLLDGVRIWNQHLSAAEGRKQRLLGYDSKAVVSIPSGEHALQVRLIDPERNIDASDTVVSRYTNGRKRSLRINLDPNDNVIQLRWKE